MKSNEYFIGDYCVHRTCRRNTARYDEISRFCYRDIETITRTEKTQNKTLTIIKYLDMGTTVQTKVCKKCGNELPITQFYPNHKAKDGLQCYCKECIKAYNKMRLNAQCKALSMVKSGLSAYTPRELMEELRRRGYTGVLEYTEVHKIDITKI